MVVMYDLAKADQAQMTKVESLCAAVVADAINLQDEIVATDSIDETIEDGDLEEEYLDDEYMVEPVSHFYILTGSDTNEITNFCQQHPTLTDYICTCDPVTLKTIVRANPGVIVLQNGTVIDKYNLRNRP